MEKFLENQGVKKKKNRRTVINNKAKKFWILQLSLEVVWRELQ